MEDLPSRLRRETADLHSAIETATGLPQTVCSRLDYQRLLTHLLGFHQAAESVLADSRWNTGWEEHGLDPRRHQRSHLIEDDLRAMQAPRHPPATAFTGINNFPGALGCLYVVEGSALGGRMIAPMIRAAIGDVPLTFFTGSGRAHPSPWRAVIGALRQFGCGSDCGDVVDGARTTYAAFERFATVSPPEMSA